MNGNFSFSRSQLHIQWHHNLFHFGLVYGSRKMVFIDNVLPRRKFLLVPIRMALNERWLLAWDIFEWPKNIKTARSYLLLVTIWVINTYEIRPFESHKPTTQIMPRTHFYATVLPDGWWLVASAAIAADACSNIFRHMNNSESVHWIK